MVAASRSLDFARIRARPGHPLLEGFMGFHRTKAVEEDHRKNCSFTHAQGRWHGRIVARFDIGGHPVLRSFTGGIGRTTKTGPEGGAGLAPSTGRQTTFARLRGLAGTALAWRVLAASL